MKKVIGLLIITVMFMVGCGESPEMKEKRTSHEQDIHKVAALMLSDFKVEYDIYFEGDTAYFDLKELSEAMLNLVAIESAKAGSLASHSSTYSMLQSAVTIAEGFASVRGDYYKNYVVRMGSDKHYIISNNTGDAGFYVNRKLAAGDEIKFFKK